MASSHGDPSLTLAIGRGQQPAVTAADACVRAAHVAPLLLHCASSVCYALLFAIGMCLAVEAVATAASRSERASPVRTNSLSPPSACRTVPQAMDKSHVALVSLSLGKDGFDEYRADRNISLGLNLPNVAKILKCSDKDDSVTIKADDDGDTVTLLFEGGENTERVSDFEMKLMDIDSEHLGIPETGT